MAEHGLARRALLQARDAVVRSEGKYARLQINMGNLVEQGVRTFEIQAASFGMGLLNGRYTEQTPAGPRGLELFGVPAELIGGVGLHVAGWAKIAGAASKHLHNVADGSLAFYFGQIGRGIGVDMARESTAALPAGALAASPAARAAATAGYHYSDADIAAMAASRLK